MSGLLLGLALGLASPAVAQEALPADGAATAYPELSAIVAARRTDDGFRRKWLRRAGASGLAAGALWWLYLGDSWDAGDPATLLGGLGLIAASGATIGGTVAGMDPDESPLDWEASTPTLSLTPTLGGTAILGEERPYGLSLSASPRLRLGESATLVLAGGVTGDLGWALDLDPRPQGAFDPVLQSRTRGFDAAPELRVRVGENLQLRVRSQVQVLFDSYVYDDDSESRVRRVGWSPVLAGASWAVSGRQRFWFVLGPRVDHLSWRAPQDPGWSTADAMLGPLVGEAAYELHLPDPSRMPGAWDFHRRVRLRYLHSRFAGDGFTTGAMISYFGPLEVRYDVRARRPDLGWAFQGALIATISDNGGVGVSLGVVPPRLERR